ncbi:S-s bond formation pathway protein [Cetacean poxvirus 1]|nr:S-s bond formation pathway protein [Cetacean poxvirus 1]
MTTKRIDTLYSLFMDKYLQKLALYDVPTNTTCVINIGEIHGYMKRCLFRITNRCVNNTELSFVIMKEALVETLSLLPDQQRTSLAREIGIDLEASISAYSELERNCKAFASTTNIINIQEFNIGHCAAPVGRHILLQIVNSGSVEANCGLSHILKVMNNIHVQTPIDNRLKLNVCWRIVVIIIFFTIIFVLVICSIRRHISLRYKYGNTLFV